MLVKLCGNIIYWHRMRDSEHIAECLANENITACAQSMYILIYKQQLELLLRKAVFLVIWKLHQMHWWGLPCEIIEALLYSLMPLGVVEMVQTTSGWSVVKALCWPKWPCTTAGCHQEGKCYNWKSTASLYFVQCLYSLWISWNKFLSSELVWDFNW